MGRENPALIRSSSFIVSSAVMVAAYRLQTIFLAPAITLYGCGTGADPRSRVEVIYRVSMAGLGQESPSSTKPEYGCLRVHSGRKSPMQPSVRFTSGVPPKDDEPAGVAGR